MADWYDIGQDLLIKNLALTVGITEEQAKYAYTYIANSGLVDYDTEKEVFAELAGEDIE